MLLTSTVSYIQKEIYPVLIGIAEAGITVQIIRKGMEAQENGSSFSEYFQQVKKLVLAGILILGITSIAAIIKVHYI